MIEALGYIAGFLFAFCAFPQAIQSCKEGHSRGINNLFLWMWFLGEVLMTAYVYLKHGLDMPLLINYWINTVLILVIMKYKYWERK